MSNNENSECADGELRREQEFVDGLYARVDALRGDVTVISVLRARYGPAPAAHCHASIGYLDLAYCEISPAAGPVSAPLASGSLPRLSWLSIVRPFTDPVSRAPVARARQ